MANKPVFALPVAAGPSASTGALNAEINRVVDEMWQAAVVAGLDTPEAAALAGQVQAAATTATTQAGLAALENTAAQGAATSAAAALLATQAQAAIIAGAATNNDKLIAWVTAQAYVLTSATYDADGVPAVGATVLWPDGGTGTLSVVTKNTAFPALIDSFRLTHTTFGRYVNQPTVTRDDFGRITARPALTTGSI